MVWKGGGFASRAPPFPPGGRCHLRMIIGDSWVNCHNYWRQSQGFPLEVCGMMGRKNQGHQDGKFNSSSKVRSILQYSMSRVGWHPTDVKYRIPPVSLYMYVTKYRKRALVTQIAHIELLVSLECAI